MTLQQMGNKLNMTPEAISKRLKNKNLYVNKRNHDYSYEDFKEIFWQKYSEQEVKNKGQQPIDLKIIDLYFTTKDNRISVIAQTLNVTVNKAQYVINKFLKTKEIILDSKVNYD